MQDNANLPSYERGLVAACVIDPTLLGNLEIKGEHFADSDLGSLYDAMELLSTSGSPIADVASLIEGLRGLHVPPEVRSPKFLAELVREPFHCQAARFYSEEIRKAAGVRRLILQLETARAKASELRPGQGPESVVAWIDAHLRTHDLPGDRKPVSVFDAYTSLVAELTDRGRDEQEPDDSGDHPTGKPLVFSGLENFDDSFGGWKAGEVIIVAARPGQGKTSLAQQITWHNSGMGRECAFVSLEMSASELAQRYLSAETGIDSNRLRRREFDRKARLDLHAVGVRFEGRALTIWDPPRATVSDIRSFARRAMAERGLSLLVIDYMGLIRAENPKQTRYDQISEISRDIKALARELSVPILALCQLNREAEKSAAPLLSHLRDSGSIEQDADSVLFLHQSDDKTKLCVAKNRHGPTGFVELVFDRKHTRFAVPSITEHRNYDHGLGGFSGGGFEPW